MKTNLLAKLSNEEVNTVLPVSDTDTLELVETSSQLNDALNVLEEDNAVLEDANDAIDTLQEADNTAAVVLGEEPKDLHTGAVLPVENTISNVEIAATVAQEALKYVHKALKLDYSNKLVSYESLTTNPKYSLVLARETIKDTFERIINAIVQFFKKIASDIAFAFKLLGSYCKKSNDALKVALRRAQNIKSSTPNKTMSADKLHAIYNKLYIPNVSRVTEVPSIVNKIADLIARENNGLCTLAKNVKTQALANSEHPEEAHRVIRDLILKLNSDILDDYQKEVNKLLTPLRIHLVSRADAKAVGLYNPCLIDPFKGRYMGFKYEEFTQFENTPDTEEIKTIPTLSFFADGTWKSNKAQTIDEISAYCELLDPKRLVELIQSLIRFNGGAESAEQRARANLRELENGIMKDILNMHNTVRKNTYNANNSSTDNKHVEYIVRSAVKITENIINMHREFMATYATVIENYNRGMLTYVLAILDCYDFKK